MMDVTIVYDSHFGNTVFIARIVAATFEKFAHVRLLPANHANVDEIKKADLLVFGSSWGITPDLQRLIDQFPRAALKNIPVVIFDTHRRKVGNSATRMLTGAIVKSGASLVVPPEMFYSGEFGGTLERGEPDRAAAWARAIVSNFVAAV